MSSQESEDFKKRINKLLLENQSLGDEVRNAQENLRLSANQNQKLLQETNSYKDQMNLNSQESASFKARLEKLINENSFLNDEVRNAQDTIRLSNAQQSKVVQEVNELKHNIQVRDQENETLKQKLQKIFAENTSLG